jgi:serine phosphatase RsbU (regulator of sigma subunit)
MAYRPAEAPEVLEVHLVALPEAGAGLSVGDRILAVEGIPAGTPEALDAFWRPRRVGELVDLRVQRAADGRTEDVTVAVYGPLRNPQTLVLLLLTSAFAVVWIAVGAAVAIARPDEPASRPLLFTAATVALSIPPGIWSNAGHPSWHLGVRAAYFWSAAFSVGFLHLFLVFPVPHPLVRRLRGLGPAAVRRIGGGTLLLYAVPLGIALILTVGPLPWAAASLLVFLVCTLTSVGLLVRGYLRPATALARPQLQWILWAQSALLVGVLMFSLLVLLTGEQPPLTRATIYAVSSLTPLSIAFAVLRYRLFDVRLVVRQSVVYTLLTTLLVGGYFVTAFVLSHVAVALVPGGVRSTTVSVLAALAIAMVATPLRRRLQVALDRLVYRGRTARLSFLQEAGELLRRAQPPDALAAFLTGSAPRRLNLSGAWLALPAGLAEFAPPSPAPPEPLLASLGACSEPTVLTREDLSASAVPTLPAAAPALWPWYEAGARLLVPLRATPTEDVGGGQGALVGVWVLGALRSGDFPDREDLEAVARVGQQAAVLLDYARLAREQVRQALIAQDLARAREIQRRMLPPVHGGWPGELEIAARLEPARETSGDFYDVFDLAPPSPPGAPWAAGGVGRGPLQIAIGDVQGKGTGAALVMALAQATLRSTAQQWSLEPAPAHPMTVPPGPPPGAARLGMGAGGYPASLPAVPAPHRTLELAGALLCRSLGPTDFVACALAVVEPLAWTTGDPARRGAPRLHLSNAGQVTPILCRDGMAVELVPPGDRLPLGILARPSYCDLVLDLQPGDVVVFTSDGLPEAPAARRTAPEPPASSDLFGFDRLAASAAAWAAGGEDAETILRGIWSDVEAWSGRVTHHDDKAIVVLRVPCRGRDEHRASGPEARGAGGAVAPQTTRTTRRIADDYGCAAYPARAIPDGEGAPLQPPRE